MGTQRHRDPPGVPGGLGFLHSDDVQSLPKVRTAHRLLPRARPIYLEKERPSSMEGVLVLQSTELAAFERALDTVLELETKAQAALELREHFDVRSHRTAWEIYLGLLLKVHDTISSSAYGSDFPASFWLFHSTQIARSCSAIPRRALHEHRDLGPKRAGRLKYSVLARLLARAREVMRTGVEADDRESPQGDMFELMADNILIWSVERVGLDLTELDPFLENALALDGIEFRRRWAALRVWLRQELGRSVEMRELHRFVAGDDIHADTLLTSSGFVTYLASRPDYDSESLLGEEQVTAWEALLERLKLFELLYTARRQIVRVHWQDGALLCEADGARRLGGRGAPVALSPGMRPLDFMSPWVVNPSVVRSGLMYDLSNFSALLTRSSSAPAAAEHTFRSLVVFQQRIDVIASEHRLYREKYLGDAALYTGRDSVHLCLAAIRVQNAYREALESGFPINEGLRIALNHGEYRLLRLRGTRDLEEERYEVFGQSTIELFRLASGKSNRDYDDVKLELVASGYDEQRVDEMLGPLLSDESTDQQLEPRFEARLSKAGQLDNEGIVTTAPFLSSLEALLEETPLQVLRLKDRSFVVVHLEADGTAVDVGIRRLGLAHLKGLDTIPVFELVDAASFASEPLKKFQKMPLTEAVDRLFTAAITSGSMSPQALVH